MLNRGYYPYKINVFVCRGQIFEAEGEIQFSPVYRHIVLLLSPHCCCCCCWVNVSETGSEGHLTPGPGPRLWFCLWQLHAACTEIVTVKCICDEPWLGKHLIDRLWKCSMWSETALANDNPTFPTWRCGWVGASAYSCRCWVNDSETESEGRLTPGLAGPGPRLWFYVYTENF